VRLVGALIRPEALPVAVVLQDLILGPQAVDGDLAPGASAAGNRPPDEPTSEPQAEGERDDAPGPFREKIGQNRMDREKAHSRSAARESEKSVLIRVFLRSAANARGGAPPPSMA
jgi:hypothetical protein